VIRPEVKALVELGPLPPSSAVNDGELERYEGLLEGIVPPVTDEEARQLVRMFGPDDCFGAAWTLLHLIESAPGWPLRDVLDGGNEWTRRLQQRADRA
jgi:hypothetical protein